MQPSVQETQINRQGKNGMYDKNEHIDGIKKYLQIAQEKKKQYMSLSTDSGKESEQTQEENVGIIGQWTSSCVATIAFVTETIDRLVRLHIPRSICQTLEKHNDADPGHV